MEVVIVNTTNTGDPAGWWPGDNKHAANVIILQKKTMEKL